MLTIKKDLEANRGEDYLLKDIAKSILDKYKLKLENM